MDQELPEYMKEDNLSEETKTLISSLPSDNHPVGKLYKYQGCWYFPNTLQGVVNFQKGFKPQDTDIILASFPKSGTTWLKALTFALLERSKNRPHPLLSNNPHALVPFLEINLYLKSSEPELNSLSLSSPRRLFSTHMPLHALQVPLKASSSSSTCKIVYVYRNVKDVLVSLWHFRCAYIHKVVDKSILESVVEWFCRGGGFYGPFWDHVLSYWRGSVEDSKHVLFMRYEEMKAEPVDQIKRLAEFMGCPFTEEEEEHGGSIDKILELCSLRKLSGLEINKTGMLADDVHNSYFFRKGEVGDFKNHLTPEMQNKIDMITEEKYKGSGFKF